MASVASFPVGSSEPVRQLLSNRFAFQPGQVPPEASESQRRMLQEFKRRLENGVYRLVAEPCPCGFESQNVIVSDIDRYGLPLRSVLCAACGTVRIDPYLDTPSLENFYTELYQDLYGRALEPESYFERQRAYGRKIRSVCFADKLRRSPSVLEVGCGAGGGLSEFQAAGFRTVGCDFSERLIGYGRERGVRDLVVGDAGAVRQQMAGERFEFIFLHHVYEHVSQPIALLRDLQTMLTESGRILIIVPDLSRIDRYLNPAGNALDFFHVAHKYNYSVRGLESIARQAGLTASSLAPPERLRTAWSRSPELWVEMRAAVPETSAATGEEADSAGERVWHYLHRTEQLYQWGCCPAQLKQTLRQIRPDRILSRMVRGLTSKRESSKTPPAI